MMADARELLYSWSESSASLAEVQVEEDTRDALQSVSVVRPSIAERRELLELADRVGIDLVFVGFPASSSREADECRALVDHVSGRGLALRPVTMARANDADVLAIVDIQEQTGHAVLADIYIAISGLRMAIEGWDLADQLRRLSRAADLAGQHQLDFRIAFEDSSRAHPEALNDAVQVALDLGSDCIVLNDTSGDCLPVAAANHTAFVADRVERAGREVAIAWHGHNDKGLALANSLAAIGAGASIVSGTILGIGERTGNIALEQLIVVLAQGGARHFDLTLLEQLCHRFAEAVGSTVPPSAPIVGADAFSTATGTHTAAILKARHHSEECVDLIYSGVAAGELGRVQSLLIGPNSGRAGVRAALESAGLEPSLERIEEVLDRCRKLRTCIRGEDELTALFREPETALGRDLSVGHSR